MTFKVGDIVRVTNIDGYTDAPGVDNYCRITEIKLDDLYSYYAIDLDDNNEEVAFKAGEIELVRNDSITKFLTELAVSV